MLSQQEMVYLQVVIDRDLETQDPESPDDYPSHIAGRQR